MTDKPKPKMRLFIALTLMLALTATDLRAQTQSTDSKTLVMVQVTDTLQNPKKGEKLIFIGQKSKSRAFGVSDSEGNFKVMLPEGDIYRILVDYVGVKASYTDIEIPRVAGPAKPQRLRVEMDFKTTTIVLRNVQFDTGKSTLKSSSYKALGALVDAMRRKPEMEIEIAGHTDDVGDDVSNQTLSQARARAVRQYLFRNGIQTYRVKARGYGEKDPMVPNTTDRNRAMNRRTEVRILKQ